MLQESASLTLGRPLIPFSLPGVKEDEGHGPADFGDKEILVIIFMCNHCPYVQGVIDRLIAIQADYEEDGVQLIGINANDAETHPDDSFEEMQKFAEEKGMNFPYLYDESQAVAKSYQAQCTPDIYVFDRSRSLAYHGRIDDNWKDESAVTQQDLREALDLLLDGEKVPYEQNPSMGCSIKWKD